MKIRSISDGVLFLRIFVFAAAVPCLLKLKLSRVAGTLEPRGNPSAVDEATVQKIAGYVETAIRRGSRWFALDASLADSLATISFGGTEWTWLSALESEGWTTNS